MEKRKLFLWVDDFRDAPDDAWNVARTTEEAIRAIATMEFSHISLDHDIENRPETFQPVAYFIGVKYQIPDRIPGTEPMITIHSGNPVGSKNMGDILAHYGLKTNINPIYAWEKNR